MNFDPDAALERIRAARAEIEHPPKEEPPPEDPDDIAARMFGGADLPAIAHRMFRN